MRIGQGYDIHKTADFRPLILGGVKIPYDKGLLGHSDADVLVHAIIDSIFGAIAEGDIGEHFPDTDSKYKNANSIELLSETNKILNEKGYKIINLDTTIICEKPKLLPYKEQMKENIAIALNISKNLISIKAKTKEKLDATGEGNAIEAFSIVLVKKNN